MTNQQYNQAFKDFQAGKITEQEWRDVVDKMWHARMGECLPVFQRMKDK